MIFKSRCSVAQLARFDSVTDCGRLMGIVVWVPGVNAIIGGIALIETLLMLRSCS